MLIRGEAVSIPTDVCTYTSRTVGTATTKKMLTFHQLALCGHERWDIF